MSLMASLEIFPRLADSFVTRYRGVAPSWDALPTTVPWGDRPDQRDDLRDRIGSIGGGPKVGIIDTRTPFYDPNRALGAMVRSQGCVFVPAHAAGGIRGIGSFVVGAPSPSRFATRTALEGRLYGNQLVRLLERWKGRRKTS